MDKKKFMELQYMTLRKEIEDARDRLFRIIIGGAAVVPVAQSIVEAYELDEVSILLPFVVIIVVLLFLSENNTLMRCGAYIREQVEPHIESFTGWETWLESPHKFDPRIVDKYLIWCFYLLSALYYLVAVYLAAKFTLNVFPLAGFIALMAVYFVAGIATIITLFRGARTTSVYGL